MNTEPARERSSTKVRRRRRGRERVLFSSVHLGSYRPPPNSTLSLTEVGQALGEGLRLRGVCGKHGHLSTIYTGGPLVSRLSHGQVTPQGPPTL